MAIITPTQCHCARVILKWDQAGLARRCGLHVQTICLFETEQSTPTKRTLEKISTALENAGIEFLASDGVRKKRSDVLQLKGPNAFFDFMNDVYETAKTKGGDICLFNAKPALWYKWLGQDWYESHAKRMANIKRKFKFRVTTNKNEHLFIGRSFAVYRWFSEDVPNNKAFYCYGNKLAFLNLQDNGVEIQVLEQPEFADAFRALFDKAWKSDTIKPPQN